MNHTFLEITEQTLTKYQKSLTQVESMDTDDFSFYFNQRKPSTLVGGIGHLFITGMLLSDATEMDKALGATDYADVRRDIDTLIMQGAKTIMFHFNSGGGAVTGCIELAEYIEQLPVPTIAYVEGVCASAAYKLASACSHIVATKSSDVGNIGTIMVFLDTSVMTQAMGLKYIAFVNAGAEYKSIGHTDSLTEQQISYLQRMINKSGNEFKEFVMRNRTITDEEVWKAAWYSGQEAVTVGLIDEIGNHDLANIRASEMLTLMEYSPIDDTEGDYGPENPEIDDEDDEDELI